MSTPSIGPTLSAGGQNSSPQAGATSIAGVVVSLRSLRNILFMALVIVSLFLFWRPLTTFLYFTLREGSQYDQYSYPTAIPFITLAIVFCERQKIFRTVQYAYLSGIILLAATALNWYSGRALLSLPAGDRLSIEMLALVLFWLGGFVLCYGTRAFRAGAFPLLFLLLTVPLPDWVLDKPVTAVRYGSTEVCSLIFSLTGVPFLRDGLKFFLPTTSIYVASECSGIHSTFAILIVSLIAAHLFLPSGWRSLALVLFALPIVCVSNGVRIAGLTLLAEYVDPSFLHGSLHHQGGVFFFLLALVLLFAILQLLRRGLPLHGHAPEPTPSPR
jgi:exosortase